MTASAKGLTEPFNQGHLFVYIRWRSYNEFASHAFIIPQAMADVCDIDGVTLLFVRPETSCKDGIKSNGDGEILLVAVADSGTAVAASGRGAELVRHLRDAPLDLLPNRTGPNFCPSIFVTMNQEP